MADNERPLISRDISWLSFNERVLQEAEDTAVPTLERLRFLGINSSNRDEFFRVRVATIRRMAGFGKRGKQLLGEDPVRLLKEISSISLKQQVRFESAYSSILNDLRKQNIRIINEEELNAVQGRFVKNYFKEKVQSLLAPVMISSAPKFPYLKDNSIYLAIKFSLKTKSAPLYSVLEIPTDDLSRFLILPQTGASVNIILLDDVIRYCLDDIFHMFDYRSASAFTIKITRDAELDIDSDVSKSWMEKIQKSVKQRKKGAPVRFVFDKKIPKDLLQFILKKINLKNTDNLTPGGRYHNFKDFVRFPEFGSPNLSYSDLHPMEHPEFSGKRSLLNVIKEKDVLLAYPYHSFSHIIDLIRESSIDPNVISINITLYRAATHSSIINALINAVKNGKKVTAVVELQARFDEETNIKHANKLQEEGVRVIFGVPGLKVHSKLFLITRKEKGKLVKYAQVGTGNFNENTAKVYTDHALLTADKRITGEIERLFEFYQDNYKLGHYKHLIISPFNTRKRFLKLLDHEIKNAIDGKPAFVILKMNSLVDKGMIAKLYEAGRAGVKVSLIVRGICSLVPDLSEFNGGIRVISIVDRFLEHSRIFVFCNNGDELYFLSSGDWMYRNLDHRSEVATPIYDKELKRQLKRYLDIQLNDNVKARIIDSHQKNNYVQPTGDYQLRSQFEIYNWLKLEKERFSLKV